MFNLDVGTPSILFKVSAAAAITGVSAAAVSASYAPVAAASAASARVVPGRVAVTHFSGSSDVAAQATIEMPAGTIVWSKYFAGTNYSFSENFDPPLVYQTRGGAVLFKIGGMTATNKAAVNGAGFEIASG